jgi:hypothetical protein
MDEISSVLIFHVSSRFLVLGFTLKTHIPHWCFIRIEWTLRSITHPDLFFYTEYSTSQYFSVRAVDTQLTVGKRIHPDVLIVPQSSSRFTTGGAKQLQRTSTHSLAAHPPPLLAI